VADEGQPSSHALTAREVGRIAEAFELPRREVLADAALLIGSVASDQSLMARLGDRHQWDSSMAPYYLFWLRGDGDNPPAK
jgi:hypothetical protein